MKRAAASALSLAVLWGISFTLAAGERAVAAPEDAATVTALPAPIQAITTNAPVPPPVAEPESGPSFATPTTFDHVGRIVVPVMINGHGPFKLMVDTGANRSLITTKVADALGIDYVSAPRVTVNGVTGSAAVPSVVVERMQAGDLILERMDVPVLPPHLVGSADGVLGVAGLREQRLIVDFEKDRVTISSGKLWDEGLLRIDARRVNGGLLAAKARVGHTRVLAIIDTGGQVTLGNRVLQEALRAEARSQTEVYGMTSTVAIGDRANVPVINFGDVSIRYVQVTFGDFHIFDVWGLNDEPVLIIGMDVLGTMEAFMIDFRLAQIHVRG